MAIIKKCYFQLLIMLAGSAVSLYYGIRSGESAVMGAIVLPAALAAIWKTISALSKDWRSAESWFFAVFFLAIAGFLGFLAVLDIAAYPYMFY